MQKISVQKNLTKIFIVKMIYVNDSSIGVVRTFIKIFMQEIFVQVFAYKNYFTTKKNYGMQYQGCNQKLKIGEVDSRGRCRIFLRVVPSRGVWGHAPPPPRKFLKIRCFNFESGGNFSHTMVIIIAKNVHWKINTMKIIQLLAYIPSVNACPLEF